MESKINKICLWLFSKGFKREACRAKALLKRAGMRPLPVNRAEVNYVANALLDEIRQKLLKINATSTSNLGGLSFSPLMLHEAVLDKSEGFFESTEIGPIINFSDAAPEIQSQILRAAEIMRSSEDYSEAIERLGGLAEQIRTIDPEASGHIDSFFLEEQLLSSMPQNISEYLNATASMMKKNIAGEDILINYILTFSDAVEGGGDASWDTDPNSMPPEHTITVRYHPGSATLKSELIRYQEQNKELPLTFEEEVEYFVNSIKPYVVKAIIHEQTHAEDIISEKASAKGEKIWSSTSGAGRTLKQVAEDSGVKGGAARLLVVNYNNLFGEKLGFIQSYQDIYDQWVTSSRFSELIEAPITEDKVIRLVPSFEELYFYDEAFYVFTKEELKAHLNDVLTELIEAFESNDALNINSMRPEDLFSVSKTAKHMLKLSEIRPVDSLIKTPIGFLDILKKKRKRDFEFGMNHIYDVMIQRFGGDGELTKEAVLKKRLRKSKENEKGRMEWALVSKKNPKKILKWFGTKRPTKRQVAKEEARVHAFARG